LFQLAANMGTSVEMIESFYSKKRMRSEDGNGGNEVQGTMITQQMLNVRCQDNPLTSKLSPPV
jgi:hypothetical protein